MAVSGRWIPYGKAQMTYAKPAMIQTIDVNSLQQGQTSVMPKCLTTPESFHLLEGSLTPLKFSFRSSNLWGLVYADKNACQGRSRALVRSTALKLWGQQFPRLKREFKDKPLEMGSLHWWRRRSLSHAQDLVEQGKLTVPALAQQFIELLKNKPPQQQYLPDKVVIKSTQPQTR